MPVATDRGADEAAIIDFDEQVRKVDSKPDEVTSAAHVKLSGLAFSVLYLV
jgi:hypothetical protein